MKILAELRKEVESGGTVYAHPQRAFVARDTDIEGREWYVFWSYEGEREHPRTYVYPDGTIMCHVFHPEWDSWGVGQLISMDDCYPTLDALLADWPMVASQPIWDTERSSGGGVIYYQPGPSEVYPLE